MSFQGSLSTLDLPEVLGILAGTAKSGELYVAGNRTAGMAQMLPSPAAWLELNPDAPAGPVALRADQWRLVVIVAEGNSVESTVTRLGVGQLPGWRAIREIVEAGLVTVQGSGGLRASDEVSVDDVEPIDMTAGPSDTGVFAAAQTGPGLPG